MNIEWAPSPNYRAGRKGRQVIAIVNHITAGLMPGTLSWLQNPSAQASAHYLVTKAGQIFQLVKDEDTAWHAGVVNQANWSLYDGTNPNYYTLGIENEALAGEALTEQQYQATLWLHQQLTSRWNIPIDQDHIIGHYRLDSINRPNDPGPQFPWNRLFADLTVIQPIPAQSQLNIKVGNKLIAGITIENRAYAPVRELGEALGSEINWDSNTNTVLIQPPSTGVTSGKVRIVVSNAVINGLMIDNHVFTPVRDLAESLGHQVSWDSATKTVIIG
ncbi:MAG: N-acetylmuramoyl-L-alanine amidase [Syntrophomonas sp.]|nr:N-acetylmuramoyl-L-alanine amidase [Syntrophomonas sp.]